MCTVSNIGDTWRITFPEKYPWYPTQDTGVSRHEFEILKKDLEELKKLLEAAKRYDEATGQKDCEMEDKVAFIKRIADSVGVDLKDVLK